MHKLRTLIDEQNVEALQEYLEANPDINLNHITANGTSALWLAIMPPNGKDISLPIIELLINTKRIDPTQTQYTETVDKRNIPFEVFKKIVNYERQYIHQQTIERNASVTLQTIASNRQNTHESLIVKTYDSYVEQLYRRYVIGFRKELSWDDSIQKYINSQPHYKLNTSLENAVKRIQTCEESREIMGLGISITNAKLLMLLWHAYCDTSPNSFVNGTDMSCSEQMIRKNNLLDALITTQNTYGSDSPACFMGTRHKIIESLDKVHCDCLSYVEPQLLPEHITEMYSIHCYEAMCSFEKDNPSIWDLYVQYIWTDINNTELSDWMAGVTSSFLIKMKKVQNRLLPAFKMEEIQFDQLLELYSDADMPLDNRLHPKARLSEQLSSIQLFLNNPTVHLVRWVKNGLQSIREKDINWSQLMRPGAIDDIYSESVLWSILERLFQEKSWSPWLNALTADIKAQFFKTLISSHKNTLTIPENNFKQPKFSSEITHQVALDLAMNKGCWRNFHIEDALIFENKDLRGFNFSSTDLSKIKFKNCDLRLTGILANPTLTHEHLNAGNQIEKDAIFIAGRNNLLIALNILTDKQDWEKEKSPQNRLPMVKILENKPLSMPPLFFAAKYGRINTVRLLLNKISNTELRNFGNGIESILAAKSEDMAFIIFQKYASNPEFLKYRYHGSTIFIYALTHKLKNLAEKILVKYPFVACDTESDYEEMREYTALEISLRLNSPQFTQMIFSQIPSERMVEILKNRHTSTLPSLLQIFALKGNAYVAIITEILKISPKSTSRHINEGHFALVALAETSTISYDEYNEVIKAILTHCPFDKGGNRLQGNKTLWDGRSETVLTAAAKHNNYGLFNAMLQKFPSISLLNAPNTSGFTPLMIAADLNHHEIMDVILEFLKKSTALLSEEVINSKCENRIFIFDTAIILAIKRGHLNVVNKLLKASYVEPSYQTTFSENILKHQNSHGDTPLHIAIKYNSLPIIKAILETNSSEAILNCQNAHGETPLISAINKGHSATIKTILEFNSSEAILNCQNTHGETPLISAIKNGHFDAISIILEFNSSEAVLNFKNAHGENLASLAFTSSGSTPEIKALIESKLSSPCYLLEVQIKQLTMHGEQLTAPGCSQEEIAAGQAAIHLATNLKRQIKEYYTLPENIRKNRRDEIDNLLRAGYHTMGENIRPGCIHQSLINMATCFFSSQATTQLTPIGEATSGYLFQTTRQKIVNDISCLFNKLNPLDMPERSTYYHL